MRFEKCICSSFLWCTASCNFNYTIYILTNPSSAMHPINHLMVFLKQIASLHSLIYSPDSNYITKVVFNPLFTYLDLPIYHRFQYTSRSSTLHKLHIQVLILQSIMILNFKYLNSYTTFNSSLTPHLSQKQRQRSDSFIFNIFLHYISSR